MVWKVKTPIIGVQCLQLATDVQARRQVVLADVVRLANYGTRLPVAYPRDVCRLRVQSRALLTQNVGMHAEALEQLLSLLVRLFPLGHREGAFAPHQAVKQKLVLMRDPLHALLLDLRVQTSNLARC